MRLLLAALLLALGAVACGGGSDSYVAGSPTRAVSIEHALVTLTAYASVPRPTATPRPRATPTPMPPQSVTAKVVADTPVYLDTGEPGYVLGTLRAGQTVQVLADVSSHWLGVVGIGWVRDYSSAIQLVGAPALDARFKRELGVPLSPPYSPDFRTGDVRFDRILDALQSKDLAALTHLASGHMEPCQEPHTGIGAQPVCPPGVPEGTPVVFVYGGSCEPTNGAPDEFAKALVSRDMQLFAISAWSDNGAELIFTAHLPSEPQPVELGVGIDANGALVSTRGGCGGNAIVGLRNFTLPPLKPSQLQ